MTATPSQRATVAPAEEAASILSLIVGVAIVMLGCAALVFAYLQDVTLAVSSMTLMGVIILASVTGMLTALVALVAPAVSEPEAAPPERVSSPTAADASAVTPSPPSADRLGRRGA